MSDLVPRLRRARGDEMPLLGSIDDDACTLFVDAGRDAELGPTHPFVVGELARWRAALDAGDVVFAVDAEDEPVGFASLGFVDGLPHLQQLSVRRRAMKRGIGRALLEHAIAWSRPSGALLLTTYADLPWNRPFYERAGFVCLEESKCGPALRAILDEERHVLPAPEQRVAMVLRLAESSSRPAANAR